MIQKEEYQNICILYDSITNAVFTSQVLAPLLQTKETWLIISFEQTDIAVPTHSTINFIVLKRTRYLCSWSLHTAIAHTKQILQKYTHYRIIARGPFAGYIALHAATASCKQIIIQARGLAAQEYAYAHRNSWWFIKKIRTYLLTRLEQTVYSTNDQRVTIEAVSPALKQYLITYFHADEKKICVAVHDIPPIMSTEEQLMHRTTIRAQLAINERAVVYCYSGSYKPWQCPQETIRFFQEKTAQDPNAFLLLLTPDVAAFKEHLMQTSLTDKQYYICNVAQDKLFHYLAAADFGILIRKSHVINYVSRPTKALEYHAAGLCILHNETVDYINYIPDIKQQITKFSTK